MSQPNAPQPLGPLAGIRVIDMTALLPGPLASLFLADYGADVIKVEGTTRPDGGREDPLKTKDGISYRFGMLNRNKRAFAVDLKAHEGREAFLHLVDTADVLIEGFRPGVMDRLGVGYDSVSARNPRIVYCSLSGYGQDGPFVHDPGHDINYLSSAGMIGLLGKPTNNPSQPVQPPWIPVADVGGGSLMALVGILTALTARTTTGRGDHVDVSMTDGMFFWQNARLHTFLAQQREPTPSELSHAELLPGYGIYTTGDEKLIALGCLERIFWANLRTALDLEGTLPEIQPRDRDAMPAREAIAQRLQQRDRDTWLDTFRRHDVPASSVLSMSELPNDPFIRARQLLIDCDLGDGIPTHVGFPIKLRHTAPALRTPAPLLGAHTEEILEELGYEGQRITELRDNHTII